MPNPTQRGPSPADLDPESHGLGADYVPKWSQRHAQAEHVDRTIRSMAFPGVGDDPGVIETFAGEDPAALGMSVPTGFQPHHMLNHAQTLRKWEVPDLPPSHHAGFGSSVATNIAEGNIPDTPHLQRHLDRLANRMAPGGHADPLGAIVASRRQSIQDSLVSGDPDAAWYQGKAQALIHHAATEHDVPVPLMRKTVAAESPRSKWDLTYSSKSRANVKSGLAGTTVFPNITDAGRIVEASKGRSPDEAAAEVVARKIPGVGRQGAARIAASMMQGTMHGSDPIPKAGESEKIDTFEVNLADPVHPVYGESPYVRRHQLSGHTADVQDARAGGFHEEQLEVPRTAGKPFHEEFLSHPAGADIAQSTALVARTEEFERQRGIQGEGWARVNAINFFPGPSQSMQWSVARKSGSAAEGNVAIPEHVQAAYDARPKPTGFGGYHGPGTKMTKRDWGQM
jgi:hypothetical protein